MKRWITLALLVCAASFAVPQNVPQPLTRAQAEKDTRTLLRLLEASHPDPYTNLGGKVAFARKAHQLVESIPSEGISASDLRSRLSAFLSGLRDGHTFLMGGDDRWRDPAAWLPVSFRVTSDGLFISSHNTAVLRGTRGYRLRGVNGIPLAELVRRAVIPAENMYGDYLRAGNVVRSFKMLSNVIPGLDRSGGITYNLESPTGAKEDRTIPWSEISMAMPDAWSDKPAAWAALEPSDAPFYFRFLDSDRTAYFRVANIMGREAFEMAWRQNWGDVLQMLQRYYRQQKKDMPADIGAAVQGVPSMFEVGDQLLREMKRRGTERLVIDLRDNGGGVTPSITPFLYEMYGDRFFEHGFPGEYVTVESQLFLDKQHATVEQWREKQHDPNFQLGDYRFEQDDTKPAADRRSEALAEYKKLGLSFADKLQPLAGKAVYTPARVVVLCDERTYSAAFHMMFYLRQLGAKVVGVPPMQSPNAYMEMTEFTLPESGIRGSISNSAQFMLPDNPTADTYHPDMEVTYDIYRKYDFSDDAALRYALEAIAQGKL